MKSIFCLVCINVLLMMCVTLEAVDKKPLFSLSQSEIFTSEPLKSLADAVAKGELVKIEEMVSHGVDLNSKAEHGFTVLYWAMNTQNKESFKKLLQIGADPNIRWDSGNSVMYWCAGLSDSYYLETVLEYGGDPNIVNPKNGETPLFRVVTPDGKKNLKILLNTNVDLDHKNKFGNTALLEAASLNQFDVVYKLIGSGADYSIKNRWGNGLEYFLKEASYLDKNSDLYIWYQKVYKLLSKRTNL